MEDLERVCVHVGGVSVVYSAGSVGCDVMGLRVGHKPDTYGLPLLEVPYIKASHHPPLVLSQ